MKNFIIGICTFLGLLFLSSLAVRNEPQPNVAAETTAAANVPPAPAQPFTQAPLSAAELKVKRQAIVKWMQEYLWDNGYEMKIEVQGTTLHLTYALAGDAFAYQFGKHFMPGAATTLRSAGFTKVVLHGYDSYWAWSLKAIGN